MIVDILNTSYRGGAGAAARRLHESLLDSGLASRFWHSDRVAADPSLPVARQLHWQPSLPQAIARKARIKWDKLWHLAGRSRALEIFSDPRSVSPTPFQPQVLTGDILHLHWIARWIDYATFFATLPSSHPVVWTLHDMNPFTGGCHFAGDCSRFQASCGNCPQLIRSGVDDLSARSFHTKHSAITNKNVHVVAPSTWLERRARESQIFSAARSMRVIPYGLDTNLFRPEDKALCRAHFDLPRDAIVIGFGADVLTNQRKGIRELLDALALIPPHENLLCAYFGNGTLPDRLPTGIDLRSVGYLNTPEEQAAFYSAIDFFVLPSLEDNLPQTGLESLSCATPVVAFASGGIPDYIHDGKTGLLAQTGDSRHLAAQMIELINHPIEITSMGARGRMLIQERFSRDNEVAGYKELYGELVEAASPNRSSAA